MGRYPLNIDQHQDTQLFIGHDYGTARRDESGWESSVTEQYDHDIHIGGCISWEDYVT